MDPYEFLDAPQSPRRRKSSALVWNVLTILVLVSSLCVVSVFFLIYVDPNSNINPFPPPTLFPSLVPPTITVTPRFTLIPSWTPTNISPLMINIPQLTETPFPTSAPVMSPTELEPTDAPPPGGFAFVTQEGSGSAIAWTNFHPDAGCDWSGVAGQATSLNGEAVRGLFVQLGGSMPGIESVDKLTMTGVDAEYGLGGFEFILANSLTASSGSLWLQLLDQQNLPLSDRVYFDTYDDCQKNLIIIYFDQIR